MRRVHVDEDRLNQQVEMTVVMQDKVGLQPDRRIKTMISVTDMPTNLLLAGFPGKYGRQSQTSSVSFNRTSGIMSGRHVRAGSRPKPRAMVLSQQ
jgi:hypothetical protein